MKYGQLQQAAKEWGVHYRTILSWAIKGRIRCRIQPSGSRQYELPTTVNSNKKIIGYIRVSSYSQKDNLQTQRELLLFQYPNIQVTSEIASGLNFKRKKLWAIVEQAINGDVHELVVTHKDRLSRFGFDFISNILERFGCTVVVLNQNITSPEEELVQDILAILHVFSSRLYGLRKYSKELKDLQNDSRSRSKKTDKSLDEVM